MNLRRKVGELLECRIGGHPVLLRRVKGRYDYQKDAAKCPVCGGLGFPWGGLFHCENRPHYAIISTGQCFVRLVEPK